MISLAARRRQAREFARAVEAETPEVRSELVDPLQVVTLLRDAPPIEPDPAFVSRLRDELLSAAAARAEELHSADEGPDDDLARRRVRSPRHQRLLAIAASTLVIVGAGTATAAVSRQALPGDLLYPVKRSIETVQYQLARGDSGKGIALLAEASTRLDEVAALMTEDPTPDSEQIDQLDQTFGDFTSESTKGGQLLLAAYANDGDANAIGRIRVFTTEAAAQLRELPEMPPDIGPTFSKAATTVGVLDGIAVRICPDCGGSLPQVSVRGQVPSAALAHALDMFLAENPNLDSSDLSTLGPGDSHHGTLPGGPTASGPNPSVSSTASASPTATSTASNTAAEPTAGDTSTTEATGAPTATESNQTAAASVPTPADVPTPVPTVQDGEPPAITISIPKPTASPT
jgi:hypothetical protein